MKQWIKNKGLSLWAGYFFLKFLLFAENSINFNAVENLLFACFLLINLPYKKILNFCCVVIAIALFWHDSKLPGLQSLIDNASLLLNFNLTYVLGLLNEILSWTYIVYGAFAFLILRLLVLSRIISIVLTILVFGALIVLSMIEHTHISEHINEIKDQYTDVPTLYNKEKLQVKQANKGDIESVIKQFYAEEATRHINFPKQLAPDAEPFEILILNICSVSWNDLQYVQMENAPLLSKFDILLNNFNSATSYSGPAALRLIQSSCGQVPHKELYSNLQCNLFNDLAHLGFQKELMMDHNGNFDDYLVSIRKYGNFSEPLISQKSLPVALQAFDNSPIYDDTVMLNEWLTRNHPKRSVTFTNIMSLHDGNHYPNQKKTADYKQRVQKVFSGIELLISNLEKEHRKVMVIIVPEHGANIKGDSVQIAGLRDIPNFSNTNVPVGVRFTGLKGNHPQKTIVLNEPTSYLAISELINRSLNGTIFTVSEPNWTQLTSQLPQTMPISENGSAKAILFHDKQYFKQGSKWLEYR